MKYTLFKFRAWDWENMHYSGEETLDNLYKFFSLLAWHNFLMGQEYGVSQYTWLKDRNWIEIYENDILDTGNNAVVKFYDGRFQPIYDRWTSEEMEDEFRLFNKNVTVIWNIYQNKELLENNS